MSVVYDNYPYKRGLPQVKKFRYASTKTVEYGVYEGGYQVWEGGDDLYEYCAHNLEQFKGKRVLEIGCGQALPSILLKLNGAQVDVSDYVCVSLILLTQLLINIIEC